MNDEQKRLFTTVVLCGIVLVGWEAFIRPTFMPTPEPQPVVQQAPSQTSTNQPSGQIVKGEASSEPVQKAEDEFFEEQFTLQNENVSYLLTNRLSLIDVQTTAAVFKFNEIIESEKSFQLFVRRNGALLQPKFKVEQRGQTEAVLTDANLGLTINLTISENDMLSVVANANQPEVFVLTYQAPSKSLENSQIKKFKFFTNDVDGYDVGDSFIEKGKYTWVGIDFNYHLFATVFPDKPSLSTEAKTIDGNEVSTTTYRVVNNNFTKSLRFDFLFAKKNYDTLHAVGNNLDKSVDFGILGLIAVPILRGLQFFYEYIPNYGLAIILVTLIVRLLTFPLQYKSFKSMKAMQKIQPDLTRIKEKFKDDPQRMQRETMELFKRAGANPLGGCLPLLLQMPVFFAFYKVLYAAVELVGAPFMLWINDLSLKDPYYVLPVLMGAAFFLQQKLTPSATTDPMQKKMMTFMPVVFCLFMINLPAGLVLYIFVSTLFGIIQQMLVYRAID